MRKTIFVMVMALLCLVLMTGCNNEKDKQIGKMEEQLKSLRFENAKLKKEVVKSEINDTGKDYTIAVIAGVGVVSYLLIWWVIARRKKDETLAE
jgi:uncharacterized lipoprotein NlpE involved in copper resistance